MNYNKVFVMTKKTLEIFY